MKMSNLYIGIDPGASGAIAVINSNQDIYLLKDWPGDEVQAAKIVESIFSEGYGGEIRAAIEKAHAMPKQGVSSTFKFGMNYGMWKGILASHGIPFREITPKTWQKGVIAKAQDKKPAVAAAARMFPTAELYGPRGGKKDGRADALLIADWVRRNFE